MVARIGEDFLARLQGETGINQAKPHCRAVSERKVVAVNTHVACRFVANCAFEPCDVVVNVAVSILVEATPVPLDRVADGPRMRGEIECGHLDDTGLDIELLFDCRPRRAAVRQNCRR